jgi:hypothetical protein
MSVRNILKPRLPLVGVPGVLFQDCLHLLHRRRVLLPQDSVSDDSPTAYGNGGAGKGYDGG